MKPEIREELNAIFASVRDFDGLLDLAESFRRLGGSAILTDEEGGRPFLAAHIFTLEASGVVIADDEWNCVAFTPRNLVSARPISNDYNIFTVGIVTDCEIYPRLDEDEDSGRSLVKLSFTLPREKSHDCGCEHEHHHDHDCGCEHNEAPVRSDDESYAAYDIGLNRLFTGMYDLAGLGLFCDAAIATMDASSDEDEAMVLLSINSRVQDPLAHCFTVAKLYWDGGLTLIAEDDDGEELRLLLTEDRVAGVERIACVNNSFYCAQILLEKMPGETKANYLQLAVFL